MAKTKIKGRSTYGQRRKVNGADRYAGFVNGVPQRADVIAGRMVEHDFAR